MAIPKYNRALDYVTLGFQQTCIASTATDPKVVAEASARAAKCFAFAAKQADAKVALATLENTGRVTMKAALEAKAAQIKAANAKKVQAADEGFDESVFEEDNEDEEEPTEATAEAEDEEEDEGEDLVASIAKVLTAMAQSKPAVKAKAKVAKK
ncbi:hypothetical protein [Burkholderia phage BCSR5]|nr:hypothetical protein [Burkholderia phage BCSR5]